jgi:hypothetical protein
MRGSYVVIRTLPDSGIYNITTSTSTLNSSAHVPNAPSEQQVGLPAEHRIHNKENIAV